MTISDALRRDMKSKNIDVELTLSILKDYNGGLYDNVKPVKATGVPTVDNRTVISMDKGLSYTRPAEQVRELLAKLDLPLPVAAVVSGTDIQFPQAALAELGERLYPRTAYGILNGGSATSYADRKKNLAFGEDVFAALETPFEEMARLCEGRPKGLTPAYINPDGTPGASFLQLKLRARLLAALAYRRSYGPPSRPILPLFQMSSGGTDAELTRAYAEYEEDELLRPLTKILGVRACDFRTGVQPLIGAYTHSEAGRPKGVFDQAFGKPDSSLALPGGHGQCFRVLSPALRALHESGVRYAYLGNVDNLGYIPDPMEIGLLALSGQSAAFDFSVRTPVDVKGGILVETEGGKRMVADIGPAIAFSELRRLEEGGAMVLFNCATGLFDLDWLVPRLDEIARTLPVRFSDQDKEAGRYSQAEQVTWEVTALLPSFLSFAVNKADRFIAAKMLAETLMTSGVGVEDPRMPPDLAATSSLLHTGLEMKLAKTYGMELWDDRWVPRDVG
jgi:UTP--glucose-1-phosphate uridylyltransferase